ncbi:MAG: YegP family protein [Hyphomonadaceae bacterium]|nr:YegP family protein [Hyphomonadaceae bacterium]
MAGTFELYKDKAGEFRFRLKATNGNIILTGESYKVRASLEKGVASVQKNAAIEARYEKSGEAKGKFRFKLKASNGQIIGVSEAYDTAAARDKGVASVMANAPGAKIKDLTAA